MYVWERPFQIKVERVRRYGLFFIAKFRSSFASRRETFYVICQSFVNTVKIVNGQAFPAIFFLVIFGLLWSQRAPFDTDFFTIAFVLISYLRHTYLHNFSAACTNLTQYWAASNRIEVRDRRSLFFSFRPNQSSRNFCCQMNIINRMPSLTYRQVQRTLPRIR